MAAALHEQDDAAAEAVQRHAAAPPAARPRGDAATARLLLVGRHAGNRAAARVARAGVAPPVRSERPRRTAAPALAREVRDPAHLRITTTLGGWDYLDWVDHGKDKTVAAPFSSGTGGWVGRWDLRDPAGTVVDTNRELGGGAYTLERSIVSKHVGKVGSAAMGTWTLRYTEGGYYDEVAFTLSSSMGGPTKAITDAVTNPSLFNIRDLPGESGKVIGSLTGAPVPVTVTSKARVGGKPWFAITLGAPVGGLAAGTKGWISAGQVVATIDLPTFLAQVREFEAANAGLSLTERITKLRQISHDSGLPFDKVIGRPAGSEYADTRAYDRSKWQILQDSQTVRMPDGASVDVYHLVVGLDVMTARAPAKTITEWGKKLDVGANYSAATWAGDIGAGAADAQLGFDKDWEAKGAAGLTGAALVAARLDRYYTTRAPDSDLLGDLDAWGVDDLRSADPSLTTIEALLQAYYGAPGPAAAGGPTVPIPRRRKAVERFLRDYGFTTAGPLATQPARAGMVVGIQKFAVVWGKQRAGLTGSEPDAAAMQRDYTEPMTDRFLKWLDGQVAATGATVP